MPMDSCTHAVHAVRRVMAHGDDKYGENQWDQNEKSTAENRADHIQAMGRHLKRYAEGERIDESGHPTLSHIVARGILALEFEERMKRGPCTDTCGPDAVCDRYNGHREIDGTLHRHGTKEWL